MIGLDLTRIGAVRDLGQGSCLLEVLPPYLDALHGLKPGAHVQVLYWMHRLSSTDRGSLRLHPGGDASKPMQGVFSLRSCVRPNPIGVTEVEIVEVRDGGLVVVGLDARDGSPLIDIKAACA